MIHHSISVANTAIKLLAESLICVFASCVQVLHLLNHFRWSLYRSNERWNVNPFLDSERPVIRILPGLSSNHFTDSSLVNPEQFSKLFLRVLTRSIKAFDFRYLFGSQLAAYRSMPFFKLVLVVVGFGAKPQVFRFGTRWRVAMMKNAHSFWNRAVMQNPTDSMCSDGRTASWTCTQSAIAFVRALSNPRPAASIFYDFRPISFWKRFGESKRRKIFTSYLLFVERFWKKFVLHSQVGVDCAASLVAQTTQGHFHLYG